MGKRIDDSSSLSNYAAPIEVTSTRLNRETTSAALRERAKHYRYAAAICNDPWDIKTFHVLAFMFERIAHDFARWESAKYAHSRYLRSSRTETSRSSD
jgi:hypothetical protein